MSKKTFAPPFRDAERVARARREDTAGRKIKLHYRLKRSRGGEEVDDGVRDREGAAEKRGENHVP